MTNEIKALLAKRGDLERQLSDVRKLIHAAYCDAAGIHHGDLVKDRKGTEYKVGKIEIMEGFNSDRPSISLSGHKRTKSGWHSTQSWIGYEWTKL